jgi:hypothetical protein
MIMVIGFGELKMTSFDKNQLMNKGVFHREMLRNLPRFSRYINGFKKFKVITNSRHHTTNIVSVAE